MEWSQYNEFIPHETDKEKVHIYNFFHLKMLTLETELAQMVRDNIGRIDNLSNIHPELYGVMVKEKFVVSNHHEESLACAKSITEHLKSDKNIRITINPTLDCNLHCWYCYESLQKGSSMSSSVIEGIVKFIENKAQSETLQTIQLSFFGGEPLLNFNKVAKAIIDEANIICKENNKLLSIHFTTNGVCLTKKVVDTLLTYKCPVGFQITFDGNKALHNKVKSLANGKGVYAIVLQNVIYTLSKGCTVTIRCNYTAENILSFYDLIKDLKPYHLYPNLRFSFHKVWQENEGNDLHEKERSLKTAIKDLRIQTNLRSSFDKSINFCYADYLHNYVVNYNGDIYKCTARDFTSKNRIGILDKDGNIHIDTDSISFLGISDHCVHCRVLPLCTTCSQKRKESPLEMCLNPNLIMYASENIRRHFQDIRNKNSLSRL